MTTDNPQEPELTLTITGPDLTSMAFLVELSDHLGVDAETKVDIDTHPDRISLTVVQRMAYIPDPEDTP